jgi:aspartyl-tRNA(Asn)/glutamyl-tRNA(Gln) amidotransferase subunit A
MDGEIIWYGARELRTRMAAGALSPVEVTEAALARATSTGAVLHAFTHLDPEGARRAAKRAESTLQKGGRTKGALAGVPITIKDLMLTKGIPTTGGSRAFGDTLRTDRDAELVDRLRRAGAVIIGKTNLNELAYGVTGETVHFGDIKNPWDVSRMPGGSSGGSGVALAAGIGYASIGTDTRGSIRIPGSCCGVTGLKPTRGLVPTDGVLPLAWTLDHAGPMARSVEDVALLMGVITPARGAERRFAAALEQPVAGLKLGICSYFYRDLDEQVAAAVQSAIKVFEGIGLRVQEVEIPELEDNLRASAAITGAEGISVYDERLRASREGFGAPVLRRLEAAYALTGLDLARAERTRRALQDAYRRTFEEVDCLIGPTLPGLPAPVGGTHMRVAGGREEGIVDASCRLVAPQNMTGVPAMTLPCGFSREGLPIGLQIWAAAGADDLVIALGHQYQSRTSWHKKHPTIAGG